MTSRIANRGPVLAALLIVSSTACGTDGMESVPLANAGSRTGPRFERLGSEHTGVGFENRFQWDHEQRHLYMHGYAGGGVCVGDYDDDGRPDLYLVSQAGEDRLYRQTGDLRFEDVTDAAGVGHSPTWGTGATFADVDNDGDLDLYVCNYDAPNRLYRNNGDGRFEEAAAGVGLAFNGASITGAFADYDTDGDLDLFLLTNRLYPTGGRDMPRRHFEDGLAAIAPDQRESFAIQIREINGEKQKYIIKAGQRDRLYRNDGDGGFVEVGEAAGLVGNDNGLSATWWDYNGDGRPDLYVANDFWDPDRLYRNNGDGTFTDVLPDTMTHTPWFSMGSDSADLNNDGRLDLVAADMSPTSHYMTKIMMGNMNDSRWFLQSAEPRQYMRNAVQLNTGTDRFMEVAYLAGLAKTDWTWSVKLGDLDNDGRVDAFFTNGTENHSFDPDLAREQMEMERELTRRRQFNPAVRWEEQWRLYRTREPRREKNLAFRNTGDLLFERADYWGLGHVGVSFGAAQADLDRDGDLDVVVSNVGDPVGIYRNATADGRGVLVRLKGTRSNRDGLGAFIEVRSGGVHQVRYLSPTSGYMSANEPVVHFGLGARETVDTLTVRWPSGTVQSFADLPGGHLYRITESGREEEPTTESTEDHREKMFRDVTADAGLPTGDVAETPYDDFARQPLLPAQHSQSGPGLAWGDVDGDGDDDVYIGGPAGQPGRLFVMRDGRFASSAGPWADDAASEDTAALWLDADVDGDLDLYVGSGSVECASGDPVLVDRLYLNNGRGGFSHAPAGSLPDDTDSTGVVVGADFDRDGDLDLFVGARIIPGAYPLTPRSRLLRNEGGRFVDVTAAMAPGLDRVGLVTAALWSDANGDGWLDLLVTSEWGPVSLWENQDGQRLVSRTEEAWLGERTGWWSGITGTDLDHDGDIDYIVMNAGLNTKYKASPDRPATLYYGDFEGQGARRLVEAYGHDEHLWPVRGRSCSSNAMPFIAEKLPTYHDFALAPLDTIYTTKCLEESEVFEANTLESGVLINQTGVDGHVRFTFTPLPRLAQASPGFGVVACELDGDGHSDVYMVQNCFWREPETGRWDGGLSLLMRGDGTGALTPVWPDESGLVVAGDATGLATCDIDGDGRPDLAVTRNNESPMLFGGVSTGVPMLAVRLKGPAGNPTGVGARVKVRVGFGPLQTAEVYAGSGYVSQSAPTLFFGRGKDNQAARIDVLWPDGAITTHESPRLQRFVTIER